MVILMHFQRKIVTTLFGGFAAASLLAVLQSPSPFAQGLAQPAAADVDLIQVDNLEGPGPDALRRIVLAENHWASGKGAQTLADDVVDISGPHRDNTAAHGDAEGRKLADAACWKVVPASTMVSVNGEERTLKSFVNGYFKKFISTSPTNSPYQWNSTIGDKHALERSQAPVFFAGGREAQQLKPAGVSYSWPVRRVTLPKRFKYVAIMGAQAFPRWIDVRCINPSFSSTSACIGLTQEECDKQRQEGYTTYDETTGEITGYLLGTKHYRPLMAATVDKPFLWPPTQTEAVYVATHFVQRERVESEILNGGTQLHGRVQAADLALPDKEGDSDSCGGRPQHCGMYWADRITFIELDRKCASGTYINLDYDQYTVFDVSTAYPSSLSDFYDEGDGNLIHKSFLGVHYRLKL